eukprot:303832_1
METLAFATASSFISGLNHSMAYQVAGKLVLAMEGIISMEISHPDIKKILIELDITASLSTIKALLEDLKPILPSCGSTIKVCFEHLHGSMNLIQSQLDSVEKKCKKHKKSWWAYVYTFPDVTHELNEIKNLKKIMDHRIDLLTKSATIELQLMSFHRPNTNNTNVKTNVQQEKEQKQDK